MAEWGNFKVPIRTHYKANVREIGDLETTESGKDKLEIKCVCNYYDSDEDDNQGSFWFRCLFVGDSAERHFDNLSVGDMIIVEPTMPLQVSTNDETEFANFKFIFPRLDYVKIANWSNDDDVEEKPRRKKKKSSSSSNNNKRSRSRQNRSGKRKSKSFFGGKKDEDE